MTRETDLTLSQQSTSRHKARRARHLRCSRKALAVATWNVRSLVETSGDGRVCRKRLQAVRVSERWRDAVSSDLQAIVIKDTWYEIAQCREAWYEVCSDGIRSVVEHADSECVCS